MKFTLEIELGNDAMQTADDLYDTVRKAAANFPMSDVSHWGKDTRPVRDENGNTVGKWEIVD